MVDLHDRSGKDPSVPFPTAVLVEEDPVLELRYRDYRRRQAGAFASMIPREAVRALYARAREWGRGRGLEGGKDPLAVLLLYLEELLPLPPYQVWVEDRRQNLDAHLQEEFEPGRTPERGAPPVTVESRGVTMEGRRWRASLNLFRRAEAWRGFIAFRPLEGNGGVRTGEIFREDDPEEIRERFRSYHTQTLQAFLRSVLP